jgi:fructosamine-3-kinase
MRIPAANESVWQSIGAAICENTGQPFAITNVTPVSGGCINKTVVIDDGLRSFFVKLNVAASAGMFEAETDGLRELDKAGALRVPQPVCHGSDGKHAWLVLEFLDLSGSSRPGAAQGWEQAGHALALTHRCRQRRYGWHRDNTIGSTPQINTCADDWVEFLRLQRIGMQLDLAARNGYRWSGNIGFISGGQPVVFDPAVYYGDRETDIAMTELFGGFTRDFYRAYEAVWPLDRGYGVRKHLYNLYHLLNHLNLFGLGYLSQCEAAIDHLLAQLD